MLLDGEGTWSVAELLADVFTYTLQLAAAVALGVVRLVTNHRAWKLRRQQCTPGLLARLGGQLWTGSLQFDLSALAHARPVKLALIEPPRRQSDTNAVMYRRLHPVGKQIGTARLRRTEYRHNTDKHRIAAGVHVYRLSGESDQVDVSHDIHPL